MIPTDFRLRDRDYWRVASIRSVELASSSENIARAVVGQGVDHQFVDGHQRYRINRDMLVPPREWTYHPDSFLTLAAGDLVHNLSIEGNWIYGECSSRAGWFPASVVDLGGAAIVPEEMRTNSQISFENNSPRSRKALNKLLIIIKNPKQIQHMQHNDWPRGLHHSFQRISRSTGTNGGVGDTGSQSGG